MRLVLTIKLVKRVVGWLIYYSLYKQTFSSESKDSLENGLIKPKQVVTTNVYVVMI
jgi:hypothetical protein